MSAEERAAFDLYVAAVIQSQGRAVNILAEDKGKDEAWAALVSTAGAVAMVAIQMRRRMVSSENAKLRRP